MPHCLFLRGVLRIVAIWVWVIKESRILKLPLLPSFGPMYTMNIHINLGSNYVITCCLFPPTSVPCSVQVISLANYMTLETRQKEVCSI